MSKFKYVVMALIGSGTLVVLAVFVLFGSDFGSRWLIRHAISSTNVPIAIDRIEGNLLTGLNMHKASSPLAFGRLEIEQIRLKSNPATILLGKLVIRDFQADSVKFIFSEKENKNSLIQEDMSQPLNIPFGLSIEIQDAKFNHMNIDSNDVRYHLNTLTLSGNLRNRSMEVKRLTVQGENRQADLQGYFSLLRPYGFHTDVKWSTRFQDDIELRGRSALRGDVDQIEFPHRLITPSALQARGAIKIDRKAARDDANALYDFKVTADLSGAGIAETTISARIETDFSVSRIEDIRIQTLGGAINCSGRLDWRPQIKGAVALSAVDIQPGIKWHDLPGVLSINSRVSGQMDDGPATIRLEEISATGRFLDLPVEATGNLTIHDIASVSGSMKIRSGKNVLNISGSAGENLDVRFDMDAPDPLALWPGLRGTLRSEGRLSGTRFSPDADIKVIGDDLSYGKYALQHFESDVEFRKSTGSANAKARLSHLTVGDHVLHDVSFLMTGGFQGHDATVRITSPSSHVDMHFAGRFHDDVYGAEILDAAMEMKPNEKLRLTRALPLVLTPVELKPFEACWEKKDSHMCLKGSWQKESGWKFEGNVDNAPAQEIRYLAAFFDKENLGWKKADKE